MEPLIKIGSDIGASVKTTRNQFLSYYHVYRTCIYPYTEKIPNGEYFDISIPILTYHKIVKKGISVPTNSIEDINLLKYLINKLYH